MGFEDGHIEVNLTDTAPQNMVGRLGQKLKGWTGKRWVIVVSGEEGAPTVVEQRQAEFKKDYDEIKDHPAIKAAQEHFPGLKIKNIRKLEQGDEAAEDGKLKENPKRSGSNQRD